MRMGRSRLRGSVNLMPIRVFIPLTTKRKGKAMICTSTLIMLERQPRFFTVPDEALEPDCHCWRPVLKVATPVRRLVL